jgi:hypothetical protein
MDRIKQAKFKCAKCGGPKFVGNPYYAYGTYYVDVTCVVCSDTKDIDVEKLKIFINKLEQQREERNEK